MQREHAQMPFKAMKETPKQSTFVLTGPLAPPVGPVRDGAQPEQVLENFYCWVLREAPAELKEAACSTYFSERSHR